MEKITILERLDRIENLITSTRKEILTVDEVASYLNYKPSYIYKLTSRGEIPYSKPKGGSIFFQLSEIIEWAKQNHSASDSQIENKALRRTL